MSLYPSIPRWPGFVGGAPEEAMDIGDIDGMLHGRIVARGAHRVLNRVTDTDFNMPGQWPTAAPTQIAPTSATVYTPTTIPSHSAEPSQHSVEDMLVTPTPLDATPPVSSSLATWLALSQYRFLQTSFPFPSQLNGQPTSRCF
jgi:hypothetical protein